MTPSTDWKENVPGDEATRFERYAEELRAMQRRNASRGRTHRALHAKGLGGFEAEFTVLPDLPEHARVGLFAAPGRFRAYVRFSNGSGKHQPDRKPDVRGVAVKLVGVRDRKILPGLEDALTQDFLLIRSPSTPFRTADDFVGFVRAVERPALLLPRLMAHFGFLGAFQLLGQLVKSLKEPVLPLAATRFYSAQPVKFGPYAVRYALSPQTSGPAVAAAASGPDYLGEELAERLRSGPVSYDFQIQFYRDAATTPIEDSSVEWREQDAPFITLARLVLPRQDAGAARGRRIAEFVEQLSFDPWHTTAAFRPLGNMMRARRHAYRLSSLERGAGGEPDGSERFD